MVHDTWNGMEAHDAARLAQATDVATAAVTKLFGPGPVSGGIPAPIVAAVRIS
jgi:hypothetical protein